MNRLFEQLIYSPYTVHVAKEGSNDNDGFAQQCPISLSADAKLTIAGALEVLPTSGGAICVWPGTYDETVTMPNLPLTLAGYHSELSKIHPTTDDAKGLLCGNAEGYMLSGLHIKGGPYSSGTPEAVNVTGATNRLEGIFDCIVESQATDILAFRWYGGSSSKLCRIERTIFLAPTCVVDTSITYPGDHTIMKDCKIKSTGGTPASSSFVMRIRGSASKPYPSWFLDNVTIEANTDSNSVAVGLNVLETYHGQLIANNLVLEGASLNPNIDITHTLLAMLSSGRAILTNSVLRSYPTETTGTVWDVLNQQAGAVVRLNGCAYNTNRISALDGGFIASPVADVNGLVDVNLIGGQIPMTVNDLMNADLSSYTTSGGLAKTMRAILGKR